MRPTVFQHAELRDENDQIVQQGTYGKGSALSNSTNDGWIDYVMNNLEALFNSGGGGGSYAAGDGIDISNNVISLDTASVSNIGGIKVGNGLSIDANGVLSATGGGGGGSYTAGDGIVITNDVISLDTASASNIGGIKVGSGLSVDGNGVLSAIGRSYTAGDGIDITNDTISLDVASATDIGGIKVGNNLSIDGNGVLSATDTTYTDFVGSGESASNGLVPAPSTTAGTTKFLCEDGSWSVPASGGGEVTDLSNTVRFSNWNGMIVGTKQVFLVGNVIHLNVELTIIAEASVGSTISATVSGIPLPVTAYARNASIYSTSGNTSTSVLVGQISNTGVLSVNVAVAPLAKMTFPNPTISIVYPVSTSQA